MQRLLFVFLIGFISTAVYATSLPDFPFVVSTGIVEEKIAPDTAEITLSVMSFNTESEEALKAVSTASKNIMSVLQANDILLSSIQAGNLQKSTNRHRDKDYNALQILGYEVERDFTITIDNMSKYSSIAQQLIVIDNIVRTRSTFNVKNRQAIKAKLLADAMVDARQKAIVMAQAIGSDVKSVYAISQSSNFDGFMATFGAYTYLGSAAKLSDSGVGSTEIQMFAPKSITVSEIVNVVFKIK